MQYIYECIYGIQLSCDEDSVGIIGDLIDELNDILENAPENANLNAAMSHLSEAFNLADMFEPDHKTDICEHLNQAYMLIEEAVTQV